MAFLALIIFISLVIRMLNPVYEGLKSPITHEGETYVVDGNYTMLNEEIRDNDDGTIVQFSDIKSQKILAKEYISFVEDIVAGRVFAVKGYYDDLPTSSFTFTYNDNTGVLAEKRNAPNPTIKKGDTELEIVSSYYHVSFIKDFSEVNRIFPVKWYYQKNINDGTYTFDYGTKEGSVPYTPDEKKQVTPTITKGGETLEIVNINLSDTEKNDLYDEDIKYAMNDNSGERFQLSNLQPIANRYSTSTDDAGGDSQYKIIDGKVTKNEDWNADTAFPDYHDSASSLIQEDPRLKQKKMYVIGPDGKQIEVPWKGKQTGINYNEPGYFRYQPSTFIPNYEDSVYLSRLTGYSTTKPIENTASKMGGFCEHHKYSPIKIEQECGKLEKDACASTSCCVLLGGSRCVGGNEKGPTMKANYSDITILNRDHYFYKGKCYGNCPH